MSHGRSTGQSSWLHQQHKSMLSWWDYPMKQGWWFMKGVSCVPLIQLQLALCSVHVLATELWWCWEDRWAVWAWWLEHTLKICSSFTSLWAFWQVKTTATDKTFHYLTYLSLSPFSPDIYFMRYWIFHFDSQSAGQKSHQPQAFVMFCFH